MAAKKTIPPRRKRSTARVSLRLDTSGGANPADTPGADINTIVAQYKKHGTLPAVALKNPLYGDFTFGEDLHEIRDAMFEAEERFHNLPADIRSAADNDWVKFLDMFEDQAQRPLLENAGLIVSDDHKTINPPTPNNSPPSETETPNPETENNG